MQKNSGSKISLLVMLIIIEVMGIGIVFPILPELFIAKTSPLLGFATTDMVRHLFYGLSIALWPLGMFFGTPYLGALSDKYGRKKIFSACLGATSISYALLASSVYLHSLVLFLVVRFFSGMFAGSYEIAQASAADLSTQETKVRNMGWITLAMSMGFILGPLITSLTGQSSSVLSFGITTPFWIACALSFTNAILIYNIFNETFVPRKEVSIKFTKIFSAFLFVFIDKRLTLLAIILFLITAGWMGFFTALPLYLGVHFGFSVSSIGFSYCFIGISFVLAILFVLPQVLRRFRLQNIISTNAIICALLFVLLALTSNVWLFAALLFLCALIEFVAYSGFLAFISNAVTPDEQGKTMGGSGSAASLAFMFGSFVTSMLANYVAVAPLILAAIMFAISGVLIRFYNRG